MCASHLDPTECVRLLKKMNSSVLPLYVMFACTLPKVCVHEREREKERERERGKDEKRTREREKGVNY